MIRLDLASFIFPSLAACPIQKRKVFLQTHIQKSFIARPHPILIHRRPRHPRIQLNRCQPPVASYSRTSPCLGGFATLHHLGAHALRQVLVGNLRLLLALDDLRVITELVLQEGMHPADVPTAHLLELHGGLQHVRTHLLPGLHHDPPGGHPDVLVNELERVENVRRQRRDVELQPRVSVLAEPLAHVRPEHRPDQQKNP